ncbi:MAG: sugar-binding domain-containing protein, partial [Ignavibacteriaceae bacterium]
MTNSTKSLTTIFGITFFLLLLFLNLGIAQKEQHSVLNKRTKECFDFNWMFHKGNIAMKPVVQAGGQGGLTDVNVKIITAKDTVIDYANVKSAAVFYPRDWSEVNIPHDWCVEGTFEHNDSLGNQPAANGYLPTGIGFYRKEFEIPESDMGRKIIIEFDGIFRNSTVWVNGFLVGNHLSGYTPSFYDLTDVLRYG